MRTSTKVGITAEQFPDRVYVGPPATGGRGHWFNATSVERGPILSNARSVPAAKAAFVATVEKMLDTWTEPTILTFKGYVGVVFQSIGLDNVSWTYQIICPSGLSGGRIGGIESLEACERSCRSHISQHATNFLDDASVVEGWKWLLEDQRDSHLQYAGFQRAYVHIDSDPTFAGDPHNWASHHAREFQPSIEAIVAATNKQGA